MADRSPGGDADGDGRDNLVEFFIGTDLLGSDLDHANEPRLFRDDFGRRVRLSFQHRRDPPGITFIFESSTDLVNWTPVGEGAVTATSIYGSMETREASIDLGDPGTHVCLRLRVAQE